MGETITRIGERFEKGVEESMKPSKKLQESAYHEAGHAVAAYINQIRFKYVAIEPWEDSLGHIMYGNLQRMPNPKVESMTKVRNFYERRILVELAGHAAERIFTGRNNWAGSRDDMSRAVDFASYICGSNEAVEAYLKWLSVCARDKFKNPWYWGAVKSLAEELLKQNRIGYRKARQFIKDALSKRVFTS